MRRIGAPYQIRVRKRFFERRLKRKIKKPETAKEGEDGLYPMIHTGGRNIGLQVAEYYQKLACLALGGAGQSENPYELAYLTGQNMEDYLHDMVLMQAFAALNRRII